MKEKRNTKAKSKQLAQVTIVAKSLVCDASLALDAVGALRLHAPNKHIPLISTLFLVLHLFDGLKSKRAVGSILYKQKRSQFCERLMEFSEFL